MSVRVPTTNAATREAKVVGIVAAGLIAFGVYSLSDARYRRI